MHPSFNSKMNLGFILTIAMLVAFCGMGYELLLARFLSLLTTDSILSQSLTIGTFLLSLGLGAFLYGRKKREDLWTLLLDLELAIAIVAAFALPVLSILSIYVQKPLRLVILAQVFTVAIGTLSGFELPALIDAARKYTDRAFGAVLAANYFGSLIASILLPTVFVPAFGIYTTGWIFSLFTACAAALVFMRRFEFRPDVRWLALALAIALPPWLTARESQFEQFYLKSYYYLSPVEFTPTAFRETLEAHKTIPDVQRFSTPYQDIDVVSDDLELFGGHRESTFHLFIDQKNQFGTNTERIYHDTIVHGAINLASQVPRKVLVIGGGDGLLARELLKYQEIESITLVELDPEMINLANNYKPLRDINGRALRDPRVKVLTADGFSWLQKSKESFDGILIDLPHPLSIDLSRLYSVEFYRFVRARLSSTGFMVFDFPFDALLKTTGAGRGSGAVDLGITKSVLAAVQAAGFSSYKAFGSWESFLIATPNKRVFNFNYETLEDKVAAISAFNLMTITLPDPGDARPNSIFRPQVIKVRLDGG